MTIAKDIFNELKLGQTVYFVTNRKQAPQPRKSDMEGTIKAKIEAIYGNYVEVFITRSDHGDGGYVEKVTDIRKSDTNEGFGCYMNSYHGIIK